MKWQKHKVPSLIIAQYHNNLFKRNNGTSAKKGIQSTKDYYAGDRPKHMPLKDELKRMTGTQVVYVGVSNKEMLRKKEKTYDELWMNEAKKGEEETLAEWHKIRAMAKAWPKTVPALDCYVETLSIGSINPMKVVYLSDGSKQTLRVIGGLLDGDNFFNMQNYWARQNKGEIGLAFEPGTWSPVRPLWTKHGHSEFWKFAARAKKELGLDYFYFKVRLFDEDLALQVGMAIAQHNEKRFQEYSISFYSLENKQPCFY